MLRFPVKKPTRPAIHLTALIDIVFLLLIFFLLASSFVKQQGVAILIPQMSTESGKLLPEVTVTIDQGGILYFNGATVSREILKQQLLKIYGNAPEHNIAIAADRRTQYDNIVQVIDIAKAAGAKNILLITQHAIADE